MSTIWIKEFIGGLDTRRLPETTVGGVLIKAEDGHINRGGEIEQRAAFIPEYELPADATVGLAAGKDSIYVFGSDAPPTLPSGVAYQRLQHPDGVTELTDVRSYDLHGGKIYAVGEFADGSRYHFYDGVRIPDWYDGRARASFRVSAGGTNPAVAAVGSFQVTGGTLSAGVNKYNNITIDGIAIIGAAVDHTGNDATTASALAAAITSHASVPDYTAAAVGTTVTITASATGSAANGKTIVITVAGNATAGNIQNMADGSAATTSTLSDLKVDGISIITTPIVWATSNSSTAAAIVSAINSFTSSPDYTAVANGETVSIVSATAGVAANGRLVTFTMIDGFGVDPDVGLTLTDGVDPVDATSATGSFTVTGGTAGVGNQVTSITINGVALTAAPVAWTGSHTATATAIASAINSLVSSPDYTATSLGAVVTITAVNTGPAINGQSIVVTVGGNVTVGSVQAMSGGADAEATFIPGTFVKTIGSRMHSVSGPNEHFSGIGQPTRWTTETVGAGFIDMSTQAAGAEELVAVVEYQNFVAVFAGRTILIWYFDADPSLNTKRQTLNNTGTESAESVTQFGDNDVFYVDESGIRSLKARDSSNAAASTDIGVQIDTLVVDRLRTLSDEDRKKIIGRIEPRDGRLWMAFIDRIYVLSYYPSAKVSAWTQYNPTAYIDGVLTEFEIDKMVVFNRRMYLRSGDRIFVYGGLDAQLQYDDTQAVAWLPYLDGGAPTRRKTFRAVDVACRGDWSIDIALDPTNLDASDHVAVVPNTTYNGDTVGTLGESTHVSLRFTSQSQQAKLSAAVIHYDGGDET